MKKSNIFLIVASILIVFGITNHFSYEAGVSRGTEIPHDSPPKVSSFSGYEKSGGTAFSYVPDSNMTDLINARASRNVGWLTFTRLLDQLAMQSPSRLVLTSPNGTVNYIIEATDSIIIVSSNSGRVEDFQNNMNFKPKWDSLVARVTILEGAQ